MTRGDFDDTYDDRYQATPDGGQPVSGLHVGRLRITPTRVTVLVALVGSVAFLIYAISVRDISQVPMLVAGSLVLGLVFAALALAGVIRTYRAAKYGAGGTAFAMALLGGVASLIAFACLAA